MKDAFEEFADNGFWFWFTTIVLSVLIGYIVNLYTNLTWGIVHGIMMLLVGVLVYSISKPND